jgi:hypothetical protein
MEVTEIKQVKSNKDALKDRMKGKHPEKDFEDEEVLMGAISDDYDEYDAELETHRKNNQALSEMFAQAPDAADFLMAIKDGSSPIVEYVARYGRDLLEDPERTDELAEAQKAYTERLIEAEKLEKEYDANVMDSLAVLDQYIADNGLSEDEVTAIIAKREEDMANAISGKLFTVETLDAYRKMLNYDADVAEAEAIGEVRGKNAKITNQVKRANQGDGMPRLDGKPSTAPPMRHNSIFDIARDAR